jgi:hypothetical protein
MKHQDTKNAKKEGQQEGWFIRPATQSLLVSFVSLWLSPLPERYFIAITVRAAFSSKPDWPNRRAISVSTSSSLMS